MNTKRSLLFILATVLNIFVATANDNAKDEYSYVSDFESGIAIAYHNDGKHYIINEEFAKLNKQGLDHISHFERGWSMTWFRSGDKCGFINRRGEVTNPAEYDAIHIANERLFECTKGGRSILASSDGKRVDGTEYERLIYIIPHKYFLAKRDGSWITLSNKGNALMNSGFENMITLKDGTLIAWEKDRWHAVTERGEKLREINVSSMVKLNKWSLAILPGIRRCLILDEDMSVVEDRYEEVVELNDTGISRFRIGSKMGYMDGKGRELVAEEECLAGEFKGGVALVHYPSTSHYKVYNRRGKEAFDTSKFDYIEEFDYNSAIARIRGEDLFGIIDSRGKWLCIAGYEHIARDPANPRDFLATYDGTTMRIYKTGEIKEIVSTKE